MPSAPKQPAPRKGGKAPAKPSMPKPKPGNRPGRSPYC